MNTPATRADYVRGAVAFAVFAVTVWSVVGLAAICGPRVDAVADPVERFVWALIFFAGFLVALVLAMYIVCRAFAWANREEWR